MDIENIYHNLRKLNAKDFEMMSSFIAKYFYRENKSYFQDNYGSYTIHDMLKKLSDKSADEICFQIHKCQDIERFNSMVDYVENAIKDKNSDEWTWEKFSTLMKKLSISSTEKYKRDLNTLREIFKNLSKEHRNILYGYLQNDFDKEYPNYKGIADMPTKLNMLSNVAYLGWLIQLKQCGELEFMKKINETEKSEDEYSNMIVDDNGNRHLPQYYEFGVAKYALSDCIEALTNNGAKEIIVTKCDDDLIVKYKPYWRG